MADTTRRRLASTMGVTRLVLFWLALSWLAPCWLAPCWLVPAAGAAEPEGSAAADAAAVERSEALIGEQLARLERALEDRLRGLELGSQGDLRPEVAVADRHLRRLESRARGLGAGGGRLLAEVRALRRQWASFEALAAEGRLAARGRRSERIVRQPIKDAVPTNDACADALPIGAGTFAGDTSSATNDGRSSCGLSDSGPDVWLRYSSPVGGQVFANAVGAGYDVVLSAHSGCPGTTSNQIACGESVLGQPVALQLFVTPGEDVLLRLGGYAGASGPWALDVGPGGAIAGTVTDAATGDPLASVDVLVVDESGGFVAFTTTGPAGGFTAAGLAAGSYFAVAGGSTDFIAELYADLPCPDAGCDPTAGTPIAVRLGEVTGGVDFRLDLGGTVAGEVRDAATGEPIPFATVLALDGMGAEVAQTSTDEAGRYALGGLIAGSYFVRTNSFAYRDEIYDDVPCRDRFFCPPAGGTPVAVELGATAGGIDFRLDRLGSISGTVRESATGDPIPFAGILLRTANPVFFDSTIADELGGYTVGGLVAGSYYVIAEAPWAYRTELYDGVACPTGSCDLAGGTPVAVAFDADTPGIDFALEHLGSISGVVTESATDEPIPFYGVEALFAGPTPGSAFAQTDAAGRFTLNGLLTGDWFVRTAGGSDGTTYLDELYDDLPCPRGDCLFEAGAPIGVRLETDTPGVDFALERLGSISGTVTDAATGEPLALYGVLVYDDPGQQLGSFVETDSAGRYTLGGLLPGNYFVATSGFPREYRDELYDDIPCARDGCEVTGGTPVEVRLAAATEGIDFALERLGAITGTVSDAATEAPIPFATVEVIGPASSFSYGFTDEVGRYAVTGLAAGTYSVVVTISTHQSELYDDVACPDGCDPAAGTPVVVVPNATTEGIDFALVRLGSISGSVIDAATGEPLAFVEVRVESADGSTLRSGQTDATGRYLVAGLPAGMYRATALDFDHVYVDQRFAGWPCPRAGCEPQAGTPIAVSLDATTQEIDFSLERGATISGTVTDAATGQPAFASLRLWSTSGQLVDDVTPDFAGRYSFRGLPGGTYFATAVGGLYADEVYDGRVCSSAGCLDALSGTPIRVAAGGVATGIDFTLEPPVVYDCTPSPTVLCLAFGRFRVEVAWRDFAGASGAGRGAELTRDTGYFWFFGPDNIELVVKVLDACDLPDFRNYWVYAAGLTDVEAVLTVTDTVSGEIHVYTNPLGTSFQPIQDTAGFRTCPGAAAGPSLGAAPRADRSRVAEPRHAPATRAAGTCVGDDETLCLAGGRFAVRAAWETPAPQSGAGQAVRLTADTGYFWFFGPANVEVVVKVLDACGLDPFHNFWVFAAGLTDVEVTLEVTDTVSGETRQWVNPQATAFQPILETGVFRTCP